MALVSDENLCSSSSRSFLHLHLQPHSHSHPHPQRGLQGITPKIHLDLNRINRLASLGLPRRVPCKDEHGGDAEEETEDRSPPSKVGADRATRGSSSSAASSEARKRKGERDTPRYPDHHGDEDGDHGSRSRSARKTTTTTTTAEAAVDTQAQPAGADPRNTRAAEPSKEALCIIFHNKENICPSCEDNRKPVQNGRRSVEKKVRLQMSSELQNVGDGSRKVGCLLLSKQCVKDSSRNSPFSDSLLEKQGNDYAGVEDKPENVIIIQAEHGHQQTENKMQITPRESIRISQNPLLGFIPLPSHAEEENKESLGNCDELSSKECGSKTVPNYLEVQCEQAGETAVILGSVDKEVILKSVKELSMSMNGLAIADTHFHDLKALPVAEKAELRRKPKETGRGSFIAESKLSQPRCNSGILSAYAQLMSPQPLARCSSNGNSKPLQSISEFPASQPLAKQDERQSLVINSGPTEPEARISRLERSPQNRIPIPDHVGTESLLVEKRLQLAERKEAYSRLKKQSEIDNVVVVNGKKYQKLKMIGRGGSSKVFKVINRGDIYALKRIRLKGRDYATARGFYKEIELLTRLQGKKYIIRLIDHEVTDKQLFCDSVEESSIIKHDANIYMVLEFGEVDLATMLQEKLNERREGHNGIDETWLRFYWKQILEAVNTAHEERILHADLKPANFLLVKGVLKLIDFGIAKSILGDTTNIESDAQVGTLNYMSPETFLMTERDEHGNIIKRGRSADIWALGCILYQMVYGKTPFAHISSLHAKIQEVANPNHKIKYWPLSNPHLLDIMRKCLAYNRDERLRIPELLTHPFLQPHVHRSSKAEEEILKQIEVEVGHGRDATALRSLLHELKQLDYNAAS